VDNCRYIDDAEAGEASGFNVVVTFVKEGSTTWQTAHSTINEGTSNPASQVLREVLYTVEQE
jgi:hypothetical protein